jgi:acetylornithine deacetylase
MPDAPQLTKGQEEAALDLLSRMIRIPSVTGSAGEAELAGFLVERMRGLGLEAELQEVEGGRRNAVGRRRGAGGGASLLFNGHIDTNPLSLGWTVNPWGGVRDDRFVYGLGCSNMKAGCAAYLAAVACLGEGGRRLAGDVVLTFVVGELEGGVGTLGLLARGLRADCFVNAEPTDLGALTMHAGVVDFAVELVGSTRHISKREEAVDAVAAACELIPRINGMRFGGAAGPEHLAVNRAHVGTVRGGLTPELDYSRRVQVADYARLEGSARYAPSQSADRVIAELAAEAAGLARGRPGLEARVSALPGRAPRPMLPFEASPDSRIVKAVNRAFRAVVGREQPTGALPPACFFVTDAAHLQHVGGMEGVVCGPGGRYNTMPDERVDIPDYLAAIRIYMATMLDVCGEAA